MKILLIVLCALCFEAALCSKDTYRAALIKGNNRYDDSVPHVTLIHEAAKSNADIVVLSFIEKPASVDNCDETVKTLSETAKQASLYIVAHLQEKVRCQSKNEPVNTNMVFDREGNVIAVYRKPVNNLANCTSIENEMTTFKTDFGVTFGLLMEKDLPLRDIAGFEGLKNFVAIGKFSSRISFLASAQISSPWAYVSSSNLISSSGIYAGKSGVKNGNKIIVADMNKESDSESNVVPMVDLAVLSSFSDEYLSHYNVKPLDLEASATGSVETVCQRDLCCSFHVKTKITGPAGSTANYSLAVFDGIQDLSRNHRIGVQNCAVVACVARSCATKSENITNVIFEKVTITGNFSTHKTIQYPMVLTSNTDANSFKFETKVLDHKEVSIEISNANIKFFGIFGRDFEKDTEVYDINGEAFTFYDYIFNDDVVDFIDYVWIRLRILIFVVSIYILEMM